MRGGRGGNVGLVECVWLEVSGPRVPRYQAQEQLPAGVGHRPAAEARHCNACLTVGHWPHCGHCSGATGAA